MPNDDLVRRTNLITAEGYKRLAVEIETLQKLERPKIVEEVYFAAKQGDRSENAEYQYGKKRLREIDRRLRFLNKRVEIARIIDPREQVGDKILFGATVTVETEEGVKKTYRIVGEDEIDTQAKKISWHSPVAKALLGAKMGDWVQVEAPAGPIGLCVLKVEYI